MTHHHQRVVLYSALVAVLAAAFWQWGMQPIMKRRTELTAKLATSEKLLAQMYTLENTFNTEVKNTQGTNPTKNISSQFNLFAYLENLASKDGISDKINAMTPRSTPVSDTVQEAQVEIRLRGVHIENLVPYLYHIENAPQGIRILKFRVKSNENKPLDVDMIVSTFVVKG